MANAKSSPLQSTEKPNDKPSRTDVLYNLAGRVKKYSGSTHVLWTAAQADEQGNLTDLYVVALDNGAFAITITEAERMVAQPAPSDEAIVRQLAADVMGYEPDSPQDLQARMQAAQAGHAAGLRKIEEGVAMIGYWNAQIAIIAAMQAQGGN